MKRSLALSAGIEDRPTQWAIRQLELAINEFSDELNRAHSALEEIVDDLVNGVGNVTSVTGTSPISASPTTGAVIVSLIDNGVSNAKLRDSTGLSVIGRSANSLGDPADIVAGSDGDVLRRSGITLGFGLIPESSVTGLVADLAARPTGSGTLNTLAKWTPSGTALGNSLWTDNATTTAYGSLFSVVAASGLVTAGSAATDGSHTLNGVLRVVQSGVDSSPLIDLQNDVQTWRIINRGSSADQLIIRDETATKDIIQITKSTGRILSTGQVTITPTEVAGTALTLNQETTGSSRALTITKSSAQAFWRIAGGSNEILQCGGISGTGLTSMTLGPTASSAPELTLGTSNSSFTTNLGVATGVTPLSRLHVRGTGGSAGLTPVAGTVLTIDNTAADCAISLLNNTNKTAIYFGDSTSVTRASIQHSTSASLLFTTAATNAIIIDSSQNVGIPSILTGAKLGVTGETWSTVASTAGVTAAGAIAFRVIDSTSAAAGVGGAMTFHGNHTGTTGTTFALIKALKANGTAGNIAADLVLATRAAASADIQENIRALNTQGTLVTGGYIRKYACGSYTIATAQAAMHVDTIELGAAETITVEGTGTLACF